MSTTKSGKVELSMDLRSLKSEITDIVDGKSSASQGNFQYWQNEKISVDTEGLEEIDDLMWYLKRANKNGTHEKIHDHHNPLAFSIVIEVSSGILNSNTYAVEVSVFNLSRISLLSQDKELNEEPNYNEFLIYSITNNASEFRNNLLDDIAELEEDQGGIF